VPDAARSAGQVMQAMIFSEILKPLTAALGPAGDMTVEALAQRFFVQPRR
jgi:hypothetical protein